MQILKATEADIPQLVSLVNSAYRGETSKQGWTTEANLLGGERTNENALSSEMNQPGVTILKAVNENEELLACVFLQNQQASLYLGMLTVSPALQNKGLGKLLLNKAELIAKEQNCHSVIMTVISVRAELIAWYERHGYVRTGKTKPFVEGEHIGNPKKPLEFLVLEKRI